MSLRASVRSPLWLIPISATMKHGSLLPTRRPPMSTWSINGMPPRLDGFGGRGASPRWNRPLAHLRTIGFDTLRADGETPLWGGTAEAHAGRHQRLPAAPRGH